MELAHAFCFRCARPLCKSHQHKKNKRCERCEEEYSTTLEEVGASFPPAHMKSRKNLPLTLVMVALCVAVLPVLLAVDLAIFALSLAFIEFVGGVWGFYAVRAGVPWLVNKEKRLWVRRRRQLRQAFLSEETKLLSDGASLEPIV